MDYRNLASMFIARGIDHGNLPAMMHRSAGGWKTVSYSEMVGTIISIASALIAKGFPPGARAVLFSRNRPEWSLCDIAVLSACGITVPVYDTLSESQVEHIIRDSGASVIFTGDREKHAMVSSIASRTATVSLIVCFDELPDIRRDGISMNYTELIVSAAPDRSAIDSRLQSIGPEQAATIIYTSGTTGDPKGVMLTHENFFHQFRSVDRYFSVTSRDRSLCFLPLSHVFERTWSYYVFRAGAQNCYLDNPAKIARYIREVRPSCMVSVPRFYEMVHERIMDSVKSSAIRRFMLRHAMKTGNRYNHLRFRKSFISPLLAMRYRAWDFLLLKKIRDAFGGDKNFLASGGAALSKEIEEFFFSAGLLICQGYGLTETSPIISCNTPECFKFGTVGRPLPEVEVRTDENGEIFMRGPNLMKGYYNRPEDTGNAVVDGWFRTGDIGSIDGDGFLRITDRLKDLIITSNGKNIAPQNIEMLLCSDPYIEQAALLGDGKKYIAALIVPSRTATEEYARKNQIIHDDFGGLLRNPAVIQFFRSRIDARSEELAEYERIKKFSLLPEPFTTEGGELTPTLKIKRKFIMEKYAPVIHAMYHDS